MLPQKIRAEAAKAAEAAGRRRRSRTRRWRSMDRMVDEFGRTGKAAGAGFYDYPGRERPTKHLWPGLWEHFVDPAKNPVATTSFPDLQERFTFAMSLETIKCVDEGVLRSTADANIGSIFGIGFPPLYGGALQYVNNYQGRDGTDERRAAASLARAVSSLRRTGPQFEPPALLRAEGRGRASASSHRVRVVRRLITRSDYRSH